jgi:hypothetical protein
MMNTFNAFVYELERFLPRLDVWFRGIDRCLFGIN